jgi:hypothetical protein
MTPTRIQGKEYPVQDILCSKFIFSIPSYQRPYAWKIEHIETLLEDIKTAMGDLDDSSDDLDSYFMGSIVVVKKADGKTVDVVDGQQRLTTLTILLSAIRAALVSKTDKDFITPFIYQPGNPLIKEKDHYHLTLRDRDAEFFREHIQKDPDLLSIRQVNLAKETDSKKNIVLNAIRYSEMLANFTQHQLNALASYILTQCYLIVVSTDNEDSAFRIFSVLNDRGLDLSYTDICKATVIGKLESSLQDIYTQKWEDTEDEVTRDGFKEVFAHIRTIHRKMKISGTILRELREYVLEKYSSKDFIDNVLVPYTDAYDVLHNSGYLTDHLSDEINRVIKWLRRIDNFDWMPPAMVFFNRNQSNPDVLLKFLTDLERLAASMMVRRVNINFRILRYGNLLEAMERNQDLYAPGSPLQLSTDEMKTTLDQLNGDIYNSGARMYILRRLDAELSETKYTPDLPMYTVEHVLPQNPKADSTWVQWYPDPEIRQVLVHRLGNLALLSKRKNSQAQNYEFEVKKTLYFNTPLTTFALTTQIIKQTTWTNNVFESLQQKYLKILSNLWRLN